MFVPHRHDAPRWSARTALALLALLAAGCSTAVPFDYPKTESVAIPPSDTTRLGSWVAEWSAENEGKSGFYMLDDPKDALGARIRLIEEADESIDAQYFVVTGDRAGALFSGELLRAADRGVRVRFLIDDLFTSMTGGIDRELSLLNAHPNIEVRLFNPLSRKGKQQLNFVVDFERANRRMHNKSFTVDNAFTIVGGRNIGEEYFRISSDIEFADLELLGFGPVAVEVSETFDLFWNNELAVPMEAFGIPTDSAAVAQFRREVDRKADEALEGIYGESVNTPFLKEIVAGRAQPIVATVNVVTDRPEKLQTAINKEQLTELGAELERIIEAAEDEVIIITPYFVPQRAGVEFFQKIQAKGVRVVIVTNSLASTNHVAVHSGYAPYRKELLKSGIELYEVKVDSAADPTLVDVPSDSLTLHTKAAVVDRETLFVGSLNLDPRSIDINSEMGLFLYAPEAARDFAEDLEADLPPFTYRVVLDERNRVTWHYEGGDEVEIKTTEPDADGWRAVKADWFRVLPLEDQL